jgi:ABC-type Fe3+/spermidine/putrescine transport system ATPase subunit
LLDGADVLRRPARTTARQHVFQDYALFPHMTVLQNVAYWPRVRGIAQPEREQRAREMLELVQLARRAGAAPRSSSGGQRQRVALARASSITPRYCCSTSRSGALDLKLREEMQIELKSLQKKLGITFVYVTHDQGRSPVDGRSCRGVQQGPHRATRGAAASCT